MKSTMKQNKAIYRAPLLKSNYLNNLGVQLICIKVTLEFIILGNSRHISDIIITQTNARR